MDEKLEEIKREIEDARARMHRVIEETGDISRAYKESTELDDLIAKYMDEEAKLYPDRKK